MNEDCIVCKRLREKEGILYEDDIAAALLSNTGTKGHIQIVTKKHVVAIEDIKDDDLVHLFYIASYSSSAVFELLQAHGTNLICNQGEFIGRHFRIDVVPRKTDDGLNFLWTPKKFKPEEIKDALSRVTDKVSLSGYSSNEGRVKKKKHETTYLGDHEDIQHIRNVYDKEVVDGDKEVEVHLIKQQRRIP
jgi:diadenosine tetraphosphate (Ap4A) HIT family hydrolase